MHISEMTFAKNMLWKLKMIIQTNVSKNFFSWGVIRGRGRGVIDQNANFTRTFFKVSNLARLQLDIEKNLHGAGGPPGLLGVFASFSRENAKF